MFSDPPGEGTRLGSSGGGKDGNLFKTIMLIVHPISILQSSQNEIKSPRSKIGRAGGTRYINISLYTVFIDVYIEWVEPTARLTATNDS